MATLYLATAPKSNSVGAYWQALAEIEEKGAGDVPLPLRDKSDVFRGTLAEHYKHTVGKHEGYKYPHSYPEGYVEQQYLPEGVKAGWYQPKTRGNEREIRQRLEKWKRKKDEP
jgi:putative ATPase